MKFTRIFFTCYLAGFGATFLWTFFLLSGLPVCAAGSDPCTTVLGISSKFALIWPAYWAAKFGGGASADAGLPMELIVAAMALIGAILILLRMRDRSREEGEKGGAKKPAPVERAVGLPEASRRNQSSAAASSIFEADPPGGPGS